MRLQEVRLNCIVEKLTKMEKLHDINGRSGENGECGKTLPRVW